jgi:transcriptional regulator with XRE-family HTH domain
MKGVRKMTVKEKLQYFSDNGMSVSFIARKMGVEVSTLSKWLRGEKGITHKNEEKVLLTLKEIANDFMAKLEE